MFGGGDAPKLWFEVFGEDDVEEHGEGRFGSSFSTSSDCLFLPLFPFSRNPEARLLSSTFFSLHATF